MAAKMYRAIHDETGEVIRGTVNELASELGVVSMTVYKTETQGRKISGHWQIEKEETENKNEMYSEYKFSMDLLKMWDDVTKPFKEASKLKTVDSN